MPFHSLCIKGLMFFKKPQKSLIHFSSTQSRVIDIEKKQLTTDNLYPTYFQLDDREEGVERVDHGGLTLPLDPCLSLEFSERKKTWEIQSKPVTERLDFFQQRRSLHPSIASVVKVVGLDGKRKFYIFIYKRTNAGMEGRPI